MHLACEQRQNPPPVPERVAEFFALLRQRIAIKYAPAAPRITRCSGPCIAPGVGSNSRKGVNLSQATQDHFPNESALNAYSASSAIAASVRTFNSYRYCALEERLHGRR
jgi:hypothetical protein